ncbi:MAG TPA: Hpt domain-containing protein [Tepidisphaeraceae bacterium]|nr:Hpt domain-containing protein [Tepidisphaeraceae bacterium]
METAANNANAPIDFESLVTRCLGDPQFAKAMLHLFATQAPDMVQAIEQALADGDATRAARAAHALKGSTANLSATSLSAVVAQIEQHCLANRLDDARQAMPTLAYELERCMRFIEVSIAAKAPS